MEKFKLLTVLIAILGMAACASASTLVLQDGLSGYTGTDDALMYEAVPSSNYSTLDYLLSARPTGVSNDYSSVIKFDLSSLPAGNTVTSATLSLHSKHATIPSTTYQVLAYPVLKNWGATTVNWTNYDTGLAWETGGARGPTDVDGSGVVSALWTGEPQWINMDVTTIVAGWVDGTSSNYGWMLHPGVAGQYLYWDSSEATDASLRPMLTVEYIPEPTTMFLLAGGLVFSAVIRRRRRIRV